MRFDVYYCCTCHEALTFMKLITSLPAIDTDTTFLASSCLPPVTSLALSLPLSLHEAHHITHYLQSTLTPPSSPPRLSTFGFRFRV